MKNKRGDITTIVIAIAVIFGLALGSIFFSHIFLDILGELKTMDGFSNNTLDTITTVEDKTIPLLDFFIFFVLFAVSIGLIIASIYIDVHPALIVVFIIALIVAILLAGQFANVFEEVTSQSTISATADSFSMTNIVLGSYFPLIILVIGIIVIIILYGKSRNVGEV